MPDRLNMGFQFKHSISLKFTEENGFFMRFSIDLLNLDEKKREFLAKDYIKDWILQELEVKLQVVVKKLNNDPPTKSEFEKISFTSLKVRINRIEFPERTIQ